jgi:NitT/TauT family transport system permease protein
MKVGSVKGKRFGIQTMVVAFFWLFIWQCAYWYLHQDLLLSSPIQVIERLIFLARQSTFWQATGSSLGRIALGFLLGTVTGTILAILTVRIHWLNTFFYPLISTIKATPVSSFIILALIWMSSTRVVIFIVFLMVLPIIWGNVTEGIVKTDPELLEMARLFQMTRKQRLRWIYLPAVLPFFMSAATTSLGLGWKAGIAAEVLSNPQPSLGKHLYESKIYLETQDLFTYTLVVILLSLILENVFIRLMKTATQQLVQIGQPAQDKTDWEERSVDDSSQ